MHLPTFVGISADFVDYRSDVKGYPKHGLFDKGRETLVVKSMRSMFPVVYTH